MAVLRAKFGDKLRVAAMAAIVKPDGGGQTPPRCHTFSDG